MHDLDPLFMAVLIEEHDAEERRIRAKRRGFGSMSPEQKREIASKGGKAAHAQGTAYKWTSEEARAAGRVGGKRGKRGPGKKTESQEGVQHV